MEKGRLYNCIQWIQDDPAPNDDTNMVEPNILQPITVDIYCSSCGQIDRKIGSAKKYLTSKNNWVLKIGRIVSTYLFFD